MNDPTEEFTFGLPDNALQGNHAMPQKPVETPSPDALKLYMIAGEASGDLIGSHLLRAFKRQLSQPLLFYGVGGEKMDDEGLTSLFPYHELSLLGVVELLPYMVKIFSRINLVVDDILHKHPDIVITIDSPGFNFRVVERLRAAGFKGKCVHYVAPTVWAYKPQRAEYCARLFDHMLVLMAFEKPYFDKAGLPCTWVGHPIVVETQTGSSTEFRRTYEIADDTTLFCLLPGSRKAEVERHMPVFAKAISMLAPYYTDLAVAAAVPNSMMQIIAPYFKNCPFRAVITANEQEKKDAIAGCDIALVKSGTVALEVALAGVPMLVTYRMHPLSAWYLKRRALIRHVNLINIIQKREVFPEFLQDNCNPLMLADAADGLLSSDARKAFQREQTHEALKQFIPPGAEKPSDIACRAIIHMMGLKPAFSAS